MTHQQINTLWFDQDALRLPSYKVGRVNLSGGRAYIKINSEGSLEKPLKIYTSLTTAINACAPMERPLLEWYCRLGLQEASRQLELSQHYGTLFHLEIGKFLINKIYDFETIGQAVDDYLSEHNFYSPECAQWAEKLSRDMAAFIQFFFDYKIIPLGIEYVLLSQKGFGTLIDLVCKMTVSEKGFFGEVYKSGPNAGKPKESKQEKQLTAIVNFKSGRNGFYRSNGIQITCERQLWEENFSDLKIELAANWSPKEWTAAPAYNFKDWTGEISPLEVDAVLSLANIRFGQKAAKKEYLSLGGLVSSPESLDAAIKKETIEQFCYRKFCSSPA